MVAIHLGDVIVMQLQELSLTLALTAISSIAAAISCTAVFVQLRSQQRQAKAQSLSADLDKRRALSDIAEQWGNLYRTRNAVLESSVNGDELYEKYGTDYAKFLNSAEWKYIREVCYFYEQLGLAIHDGLIEPDVAFVLVTVDEPDKRMSNKLVPVINYLRKVYRKDLYDFYFWLLQEHDRLVERGGGSAAKKPSRHL